MVARDGDVRVSVIVHVADVQRVARACRRRRISAWPAGLCTADGADIPRQAVVVGDDHRRPLHSRGIGAILVRNVGRPIGRDADVAVEPTALGEVVDRHARTERKAAVVAAGADRRDDTLRAVIDGMWIGRDRGLGRCEVAAAQCLVVRSGGRPTALRQEPGLAVVLGIGRGAAGAVELRFEHPAGAAVRPENGVERNAGERRALVCPGDLRRRDAVIEDGAQRVIAGLDEGGAGLPVHADGWLAGPVRAVGRGAECGSHLIVRRVVGISGRARRNARSRRAGARADGERRRRVCGRGYGHQRGGLADVPDAFHGIADHDVGVARSRNETIGRSRTVLGAIRGEGEHIHVGGLVAGPLIVQRQRGRVAYVELGGWLGQRDGEIVVVAEPRRTGVLDADVGELSGDDRSEIPDGGGGRADRAARRSGGAHVRRDANDDGENGGHQGSERLVHAALQARALRIPAM